MTKRTISVKDAAKMIGIGSSTMYSLVKTDKVPNIKIGSRYLIPITEFEVWVQKIIVGGILI